MQLLWKSLAVFGFLIGIPCTGAVFYVTINSSPIALVLGLPFIGLLWSAFTVLTGPTNRAAKIVLAVSEALIVLAIGAVAILLANLHYMPGS